MAHKPASRVEAVLWELARYGFMIPPSEQASLLANPPHEQEAFVNAVLAAEGLPKAELCDPTILAYVRGLVSDWLFDEGQGKGTRSGLPFTLSDSG